MSHGAKLHQNPRFSVGKCFHDLENVSVKENQFLFPRCWKSFKLLLFDYQMPISQDQFEQEISHLNGHFLWIIASWKITICLDWPCMPDVFVWIPKIQSMTSMDFIFKAEIWSVILQTCLFLAYLLQISYNYLLLCKKVIIQETWMIYFRVFHCAKSLKSYFLSPSNQKSHQNIHMIQILAF